jgi:hypothetical protein
MTARRGRTAAHPRGINIFLSIFSIRKILYLIPKGGTYVRQKHSESDYTKSMRWLMSGLAVVAAKTNCAFVAIGHFTKVERSKTLYRKRHYFENAHQWHNALYGDL